MPPKQGTGSDDEVEEISRQLFRPPDTRPQQNSLCQASPGLRSSAANPWPNAPDPDNCCTSGCSSGIGSSDFQHLGEHAHSFLVSSALRPSILSEIRRASSVHRSWPIHGIFIREGIRGGDMAGCKDQEEAEGNAQRRWHQGE